MACSYTIHLQKDINKYITQYIYSYLQINSFMCIFSIKQEKIYKLQAFIYREKERKKEKSESKIYIIHISFMFWQLSKRISPTFAYQRKF